MDNVYKQRLEEIKKKYNTRIGAMNKTIADDTTCLNTLDALRTALDVDLKVLALLEKTAAEARLKAKVYLENVVTNALQYISGGVYTFEIDIQELRGKPDAEFYVVSTVNGHKSRQKPQDACGGGFVDIISTALRYAYLELFNNPTIKGILLLDEPGKMISENASVKFAEFVKQLCGSFKRQTIMVTHNENLQAVADKTNVVILQNDVSVVIDSDSVVPEEEMV
jgi:DNA repair exonuclease SbcCD ATPase subunit